MNSAQEVVVALWRLMMVATLAKTAETVTLLAERAAGLARRELAWTTPTVMDRLDAVVGRRLEDLVKVDVLDLPPEDEDFVKVDVLDMAPSHNPPDHFTIALQLPAPKSLPAPARSWFLWPWASQRRASTEISISENLASPPQKHALLSTPAKF